MNLPNEIKASYNTGQTNSRTTETNNITRVAKIGTKRFPLKNDNAIGNFVSWKRSNKAAAINPAIIPIKTFPAIALKAGLTALTFIPNNKATCFGANT